MNRSVKALVLSAAAMATVLTSLPAAHAGERWRHRDDYRYNSYRHRGNGDAVAAGVIGLAAGALIGGALAQPRDRVIITDGPYEDRRYYREPAPRVTYSRAPSYAVEPWSREWYRYCSDRYRSFNSNDGTFVGYDGVRRFCNAN